MRRREAVTESDIFRAVTRHDKSHQLGTNETTVVVSRLPERPTVPEIGFPYS